MTNTALSDSQMLTLGGPDADGIFPDGDSNVVEWRLSGCSPLTAAIGAGTRTPPRDLRDLREKQREKGSRIEE